MTHLRPTNKPHKLDKATLSLMAWLNDTAERMIKPNAPQEVGDAWETVDHVWVLIQNKVGWYREKSYALNDEGRAMFSGIEHNMKIIELLYSPGG